jgi:hypothetical protein
VFTRERVLVAVAGTAVMVSLVVVSLLAVAVIGGHRTPGRHEPSASATTTGSVGTQGLAAQPPQTITPTGTPTQEQGDQLIGEQLAATPGLATVEALPVPGPSVSDGWPRLAVANDPGAWATEFVTGLLDINYAHQSRTGLGTWLQAQEAPLLLPGVPASVADKTLYVSLLDPSVTAAPTPIVSAGQWAQYAKTRVVQSVSDLLVQTDPVWAQLVGTGWEPPDVRMTVEDVSGVLSIRRGHSTTVEHFSLQVQEGSARWHPGYGTSVVDEGSS